MPRPPEPATPIIASPEFCATAERGVPGLLQAARVVEGRHGQLAQVLPQPVGVGAGDGAVVGEREALQRALRIAVDVGRHDLALATELG